MFAAPDDHSLLFFVSGQQPNEFKTISSNFRVHTLENGSLTIREVTTDDAGGYLCEAGNGVGQELSRVVRLTVHVKAHFKQTHETVRVHRGDPLKMTCEAFGERPMSISWNKDGVDVERVNSK